VAYSVENELIDQEATSSMTTIPNPFYLVNHSIWQPHLSAVLVTICHPERIKEQSNSIPLRAM
jgi:hypothetical protein